ncbi:TIGR04283 family arsenosugar biosynthesis glycosyltransferase [Burkholderiales bacterium]|nr:TIGR04283 family arsenosugar biosynthesis glycosyltransferase [Burkholderiales bacterium]
MPQKVSLSIIIPVRNEEKHLPILLSKLHSRKSNNTEIIVIDGYSEDNTLSVISHEKNCVIHSDPGRANQMNAGARCARGKYLWFLHADSMIDFDFESAISAALQTRKWGWFYIHLNNEKIIYRVIQSMMNFRSRITCIATGDQGIFIHKDLFIRHGLFPSIPLMEDVSFSKKMKALEKPFVCDLTIKTSTRRWEHNGPIRTIFKMWALRLLFFFGASPNWLNAQYNKK